MIVVSSKKRKRKAWFRTMEMTGVRIKVATLTGENVRLLKQNVRSWILLLLSIILFAAPTKYFRVSLQHLVLIFHWNFKNWNVNNSSLAVIRKSLHLDSSCVHLILSQEHFWCNCLSISFSVNNFLCVDFNVR